MEKNFKITFVMPWHISERGGGAEVQANYLAQELGMRGYDVSYVCQTTSQSKINNVEKIGHISIHYLKPSGRFAWLDQGKYLTALHSIKPEMVIQRLSSNISYVIGKYCSKNKSKFVWICTDNMSPYRDYHVRKFKKNNTAKRIGVLKYHLFLKNAQVMDWFRNRGMKFVDVAFTQNNDQYDALVKDFKINSKRMISGHPLPSNQSKVETRFKDKTILWCANFGKNKRPVLFIELCKELKNKGYSFIMVGGHSDASYLNTILKNKPKELVTTGQLSFEESLSYFDKASLFVNTSKSEGFSNTYIQSWLRGVPTLVFGADPDSVINNNNLGFVAKTVTEAADFTESLFADIKQYEALSVNAERFAKNNHTINVMTNHFLSELDLDQFEK